MATASAESAGCRRSRGRGDGRPSPRLGRASDGCAAGDPRRRRRSASPLSCCRCMRCAPRCECWWRWSLRCVFTFSYATLAAKSRRAATLLIPLLDVLQSVPILGLPVLHGGVLRGAVSRQRARRRSARRSSPSSPARPGTWPSASTSRCAPFRSIWMRPAAASAIPPWQRFWRLEVPFAMPGLIWNMMMSMSGGWFFVVASEAISVGDVHHVLPGVGSYVARAIEPRSRRHRLGYRRR